MRRGLIAGLVIVVAASIGATIYQAQVARPTQLYGGEPRPVDEPLRAAIAVRTADASARGFGEPSALEQSDPISLGRYGGRDWTRTESLDPGECLSATVASAGCGTLGVLRAVAEGGAVRRDHLGDALIRMVEICARDAAVAVEIQARVGRSLGCPDGDALVLSTVQRGHAIGPDQLRGSWESAETREAEALSDLQYWLDTHPLEGELVWGPQTVERDAGTPLIPADSAAACRQAYHLALSAEPHALPHTVSTGCPPDESISVPGGAPQNLVVREERVLAIVEPGALGAASITVGLARLDGLRIAEAPVAATASGERTPLLSHQGRTFAFAHRIDPAEGVVYFVVPWTDQASYAVEVRRSAEDGGEPAAASDEPFPGAVEIAESVIAANAACDADEASGCREAGLAYRSGTGASVNPTRSNERFLRGCELGDGEACVYAAMGEIEASEDRSEEGPGDVRARALCEAGNGLACLLVGDRYRLELRPRSPQVVLARDAYHAACAAGLETGCANETVMNEVIGS